MMFDDLLLCHGLGCHAAGLGMQHHRFCVMDEAHQMNGRKFSAFLRKDVFLALSLECDEARGSMWGVARPQTISDEPSDPKMIITTIIKY